MARTKSEKALARQAAEILATAERMGVSDNFYFRTTFERYLTQLKMLDGLREAIERNGMTVTRTYVRGESNEYTNPAIDSYNKCCNAANATVKTLMSITSQFGKRSADGAEDLIAFINGDTPGA